MTIADARQRGLSLLRSHPEAQRDIDQIVAHALQRDIAWVLAHPEHELGAEARQVIDSLMLRRAAHEPLAYLLGSQPFYGRDFAVDSRVLIPRPESELIIDDLKRRYDASEALTIVDVGTGSGALAITAALEFPNARVTAIDTSDSALEVAAQNAKRLRADRVQCVQGDLLSPIAARNEVDAILANLPYLPQEEIDESPTSDELAYEPQAALLAGDNGLALIKACSQQAVGVLTPGGRLYLEMLPGQIPLFLAWVMLQKLPYTSELLLDLSGQNRIVVLSLV